MQTELHKLGPWSVLYGSMKNKYSDCLLDEDIAILVDIEDDGIGTFLKIGKYDSLNSYYTTMINKYAELGHQELGEGLKLIKFNVKFEGNPELGIPDFAPDGYNLTVDEICTIVNWFANCSCQNMKQFFELSLDDLKEEIKRLQEIGY